MNRIGAGNFSRRFVGFLNRTGAVATERDPRASFFRLFGRRRKFAGNLADRATAAPLRTVVLSEAARESGKGEPRVEKGRVERNKFFDVESKNDRND